MKRLTLGRPMYWTLDEDGRTPIPTDDIMVWGECMQDEARKHVGWDFDNEKGVTVSTVFLGLDQNHCGGRPVLFETMIFGGPHTHRQFRYCTWAEAEHGHQEACDLAGIKRKLDSWIDGDAGPAIH